ncbi:MAG: hypothetical protein AAGA10_15455, partial [Bacteroidota bacterium]
MWEYEVYFDLESKVTVDYGLFNCGPFSQIKGYRALWTIQSVTTDHRPPYHEPFSNRPFPIAPD